MGGEGGAPWTQKGFVGWGSSRAILVVFLKERPVASNTTKIPRKDPQRGKENTNCAAGE